MSKYRIVVEDEEMEEDVWVGDWHSYDIITEGDVLEAIVTTHAAVTQTLLEKRRDYGTANIRMTGPTGVAIRLIDKVSRLYHLLASGRQPQNEAIADTWVDIVGYATIGMVMQEREW